MAALLTATGFLMISPLKYPAFKGLKPVEREATVLIVLTVFIFTGIYGAPKVLFYSLGSFAFVWGYWWVPTRRFWVPAIRQEWQQQHFEVMKESR